MQLATIPLTTINQPNITKKTLSYLIIAAKSSSKTNNSRQTNIYLYRIKVRRKASRKDRLCNVITYLDRDTICKITKQLLENKVDRESLFCLEIGLIVDNINVKILK